jgi:MoaA/NifB/PqqE/SkfB family radical SAM enzyme
MIATPVSPFHDDIDQIEIELTTRCNAACPQCVRNYYGGRTWSTLPLVDIDISVLIKQLEPVIKPGMLIRLCGTYGDPLMHREILDLTSWLIENKVEIAVSTNASLRTIDWWKKLAGILKDRGIVYFGIDGLEDTHHLHRRNTNFSRIIRNLKAFNDAGGRSIWNFIIFRHNQHQVEAARTLSQELGFETFVVKSTSRFIDKRHELCERTPVVDSDNNIEYWLEPTDLENYRNGGIDQIRNINQQNGGYREYLKTNPIHCLAKHTGLIAISAEGYVLPCGFLQDRFYGYEVETHFDRGRLFDLIDANGGLDSINIYKNDINSIFKGSVFQAIQDSWNNSHRLERCAHQCGVNNRSLLDANRELAKSWQGRKIFDIIPKP